MRPTAVLTLALVLAGTSAFAQTRKPIDPKNPDPAAVERQLKAGAKPAPKSDAASDLSKERWNDNYTNKVVATGVSKEYRDHDTNIPGDVIARKMGSEDAAMELWKPQGAKSVQWSTTCKAVGSCKVGDTIKVVVDFGYIVDTHVYERKL